MNSQGNNNSTERPYHHGDLRSAVIKSALLLLETEGGPALSLRKVAAHAGVSGSAPYRHFKDREALLAALAFHGFEGLSEKLGKALSSSEPHTEINALGAAYIAFATNNRSLYSLMFTDKDLAAREDEALARMSEEAFSLLEHAVRRRLIADNQRASRFYATTIWAALHGATTLSLDGRLTHKGSLPTANDFAMKVAVTLIEGVFSAAVET